jgi:SAM-dependent methyltransferase
MHAQGFYRLTGVDPFVTQPATSDGFRIVKGKLSDLDEHFDFVMLHHSLEHMPHPLSALSEVRRLLRRGGSALVRVPIAGTYGHKHYGSNWIGLDPPRHLVIPSRAGMSELAARAGLFVERYWFDATEWTLLASELIVRGLSPYDREKREFTITRHFTASEVEEARQRATALNNAEEGDTACFILCVR